MQAQKLLIGMFIILEVWISACQSTQTKESRTGPDTFIPATIQSPSPTAQLASTPEVSDTLQSVPTLQGQELVQPTAVAVRQVPGDTQTGFPLTIPRTKHTATLLINGKILIVGGSVEGDDFAWDNELIDPATGSSAWAAPLHTVRHDHSATLLKDGRVLVVGGYNLPEQWIDDAEVYDPRSDTWTVVSPINPHGSFHSATLLKEGHILVAGGCIGDTLCTNKVEIFDPNTNLWKEAAALQADRYGHTAQLLENGQVLIAGGVTAYGDLPADGSALIYDPSADSWRSAAAMNVPRFLAESVKLPNGDVIVAGGILAGTHPPTISNAVEIYDPDTNTWQAVAPLQEARYTFIMRALPGGRVIAISGAQAWDNFWTQDSFVHEVEVFEPDTQQWHVIGKLSEQGAFSTGTQLKDGRIWIAGGQVGGFVLDQNWFIQP